MPRYEFDERDFIIPEGEMWLPRPCSAPDNKEDRAKFASLVMHIMTTLIQRAHVPFTLRDITMEVNLNCKTKDNCFYVVTLKAPGFTKNKRSMDLIFNDFKNFCLPRGVSHVQINHSTFERLVNTIVKNPQQYLKTRLSVHCEHNRRYFGTQPPRPLELMPRLRHNSSWATASSLGSYSCSSAPSMAGDEEEVPPIPMIDLAHSSSSSSL